MKHLKVIYTLLALMAVALPFVAGAVDVKDVDNVHVADRTRYVTDMAGVLQPSTIARADSMLADIWRQSSAEPIVVIVDNLDDKDIDDYATELFELWLPGKKDKDNGVIMLLSRDDHRFVIRTGYGTEGILPDALCWNILNLTMKPLLQQNDWDGAVLAGVADLRAAMTTDEARAELMSKFANDRNNPDEGPNLFVVWIGFGIFLTVGAFIYYVYLLVKSRGKDTAEAYHMFEKGKLGVIVLTFLTLGVMLPVLAAWLLTMHHIRRRKHVCSNCHTPMKLLDEQTDNLYLTPAQDAEERLDSVDYDVWLCPNCNQKEVIPFVNRQKNYSVCSVCGARASVLTSDRVLRQPTVSRQGEGVRTYSCFNCHHTDAVPYSIPKVVAPPVIIGGGGFGRGGGFGGGGFSGGSFGGGMTGGGGSSGGW